LNFRSSRGASRWVVINIISWSLVLIVFLGWLIYATQFNQEQFRRVSDIFRDDVPPPNPPSYQCPLDGTKLTQSNRAVSARRPVIVQVDNAPGARPQSGLSQADIVYEAMAEGDITRFSAIFACHEADVVGPVRSARLVNLELVPQYSALLANSGSSPGVTAEIEAHSEIPNIVESNYPQAFYRVFDREAPHNLMSSTQTIREAAAGGGHQSEVSLPSLTFKDDSPSPQVQQIRLRYSPYVDVSYSYNAGTNSWLRSLQGDPHIDTLTGEQLQVRNVIIQYVNISESDIVEDVSGSLGLSFQLTGSGRVQVLRDGNLVEGTWKRESATSITTYQDASGQAIALNRGLTFVQLVPLDFRPEIS
jgi:hypothetical protein